MWTEHVASDIDGGVATVRAGSSPWTEHAFYVRNGRLRRIRLENGVASAEQTLLQPLDSDGDPISLTFAGSDVAAVEFEGGPIAVAATSTDSRLCVWRVQLTTASARPSCTGRDVADPDADIAASAARLWTSGHGAFFYRSASGRLRRVADTVVSGGARRFTHTDLGAPTGVSVGRTIFTTVDAGADFMLGLVAGNRLLLRVPRRRRHARLVRARARAPRRRHPLALRRARGRVRAVPFARGRGAPVIRAIY